jgi:antirestriction protein ArdC
MLAHPLLAAKAGCRAVLRNNPAEAKAMSTDVYERISSQITNELESGPRPRLKPRNAEYAAGQITHPLRGTTRADVKGVSHAAA